MTPSDQASMSSASAVVADPATEFQSLLGAHRGIIVKVAASYSNGADDRADLAQEIVLQLWRAWPTYQTGRPFATWMYRIALNVGISQLRRDSQRHGHEPLSDAHDALAGADDVDFEERQRVAIVQRAMRSLGAMDRALLVLHLEGCSHRESGEVLGISESNAATRLGRIRQKLSQVSGNGTNNGGNSHGNG